MQLKRLLTPASLLLVLLLSGCGTVLNHFVHKIDVQQGNILTQDMINNIKIGMESRHVMYYLGSPQLIGPLHANEWNYFYSLKAGSGEYQEKRFNITFVDNKVATIEGDLKPLPVSDDAPTSKSVLVTVPYQDRDYTFWGKIKRFFSAKEI